MFILQNAPMETLEFAGLSLEVLEQTGGGAKFDLTCNLFEGVDGGLEASVEYNTDLFDHGLSLIHI